MNVLDVISPSNASPEDGEDEAEFRFDPLQAAPSAAIRRSERNSAGRGV